MVLSVPRFLPVLEPQDPSGVSRDHPRGVRGPRVRAAGAPQAGCWSTPTAHGSLFLDRAAPASEGSPAWDPLRVLALPSRSCIGSLDHPPLMGPAHALSLHPQPLM